MIKKNYQNKKLNKGEILSKEYYKNKKQCEKCDGMTTIKDPFVSNIYCGRCYNSLTHYVCHTEAINKYRLNSIDLSYIDCLYTIHIQYHNQIRLYYKKDILSMCYLKYATTDITKFKTSENKAKQKRELQLKKLLDNYTQDNILKNKILSMNIVNNFLKNGDDGIKRLKLRLDSLSQFIEDTKLLKYRCFSNLSFFDNFMFEYISDGTEFLDRQLEKKNRKTLLLKELSKHNLTIRNDLSICEDYIESDIISLEEVIKKIRERDFLEKHTSYLYQLRQLWNIFYQNIIYELNENIDRIMTNNYIEFPIIAKNIALELYEGIIPEF
jgi:hypothetical protein